MSINTEPHRSAAHGVAHWVKLLVVVLLLGAATLWWVSRSQPLQLTAARMLPAPVALGEFNLQDHHGESFSSQQLAAAEDGRWRLVFFGYTSCPDVCPLEMQKLGQLLSLLQQQGVMPLPEVVFVSVDPERDSLAQIKGYVEYFHPSIKGVSGENKELGRLAALLAVSYSRRVEIAGQVYLVKAGGKMPENSGDNYEVNHSSRIFLINPEGYYAGSFASPHNIDTLYTDLKQLIEQYQ